MPIFQPLVREKLCASLLDKQLSPTNTAGSTMDPLSRMPAKLQLAVLGFLKAGQPGVCDGAAAGYTPLARSAPIVSMSPFRAVSRTVRLS